MITYKKHHRLIATFFLLIFFPTLIPNNLFASNNGPVAPEATSFEPVDAKDMVNLVTGDMSYVLPILNVPSPEGGFPLALSNHSGIAMDQEASWVGLGWSLNPGAINRSVNGYPDDWTKTDVTNFFYDKGGVSDTYNFSIGGTFPNGLTLGLGASWGSNRAFGGTVTLGYGSMSVTAGNDGIFGANFGGFGVGSSGVNLGLFSASIPNIASASLSYNFTNNEATLGISSQLPLTKMGSVGMSFNTNGSSSITSAIGVGASNQASRNGDVSVKVTSDNIGIDLGVFWFGYGHATRIYYLHDINVNTVSGSLYPYHYKKDEENIIDYKPYFVNDTPPYLNALLKGNYKSDNRSDSGVHFDIMKKGSGPEVSYPYHNSSNYDVNTVDYDNYYVTAPGLSGNLAPYISTERLLSNTGGYYDNPNYDNSFDLNIKTNFYFKNSNSSFLRVNDGIFKFDGTQSLENINTIIENLNHGVYTDVLSRKGNTYSQITTPNGDLIKNGNKMRTGNNIEVFSNSDINSGNVFGFIEANGIDRKNDVTYTEEPLGIGAYRITTIDGKTYHYSLPVYEFETYSKNFKDSTDENKNFLEIKKERKYATHWLLTAITGSDYYDTNQNGKVDANDYGYWVEFDYGKWSDGYAWRSPHSGYKAIPDSEGNTTSYSYFWGRKQIYYLDAIKTRTHTALFVKKLRKDNNSTIFNEYTSKINSANEFDRNSKCKQYGSEQFNNPINRESNYFSSNGSPYQIPNNFSSIKGRQTSFTYVDIPKNYSLALDKILLLKNKDINNLNKNNGYLTNNSTGFMYSGLGYTNVIGMKGPLPTHLPNLFTNVPVVKSFQMNLQQNILDVKDIENLQLESKSLKIVSFGYNYDLAKNSDNSEDINKGKLTLKNVTFLGKQGVQMLPSYKFDYYGTNVNYNQTEKDVWGYNKYSPEAWSLKSIKTPIGTNIDIDYEPDSYRRETISTVYKNRPFIYHKASKESLASNEYNDILSVTKKDNNIMVTFMSNPNDANILDQSIYIGAEIYLTYSTGTKYYRDVYEIENSSKISNKNYTITLKTNEDTQSHNSFVDQFYTPTATESDFINNDKLSYVSIDILRDSATEGNINGITGGGIRVKKITTKDNATNSIDGTIEYSYINPFSNKTSGITSYTPFDIYKYIPLIALLPAPGVMYEYVTVNKKNKIGEKSSSRVYEFNVLKPNNKLINGLSTSYERNEGEAIRFGKYLKFKLHNYYDPIAYDPTKTNSIQEANRKQIKLYASQVEDQLSALGSIKSITDFNSVNQILGKQKYNYIKFLDTDGQIGVKENSYYSFKYNLAFGGRTVKILTSNIIEYPTILENITTTNKGYKETIFYDKYDFLTGQAIETRSISSNGQSIKTKIVPAYIKYPNMGSKIDNKNNKNMLSQTAVNYSYILDKNTNTWKETGVGITTWSNIWTYKDISGASSTPADINEKTWRKHKSYIWNGIKDNNGIFQNYNKSNDDAFVWGIGLQQTNPVWKQISEVTLYDHFSAPLEMKDINANYASSKMGDDNTKIIATGNAGYNEMFYAGAENAPPSNFSTYLEPEVAMINASRNTSFYHTGKYSVAANSNSQFGVAMKNNEHRAGKYKVSVWVEKTNAAKARINNNGSIIDFTETYPAGNWVLKTGYVNVPVGAYTIYVTSSDTSTVYFDDLMIRPVASSITGYVYNEWDELTYIIANNGLATHFKYDKTGRLIRTYSEIIDDTANGITGGFKLIKSNTYNNKYLYK
jgi:hypothetical protein